MVHYTDEQIAELIMTGFAGRKIALMAPIVKGRKGHYRELFESLAKKGYIYARIDGEIREISAGMRLDRYKIHTIDLVVDRLVVAEDARDRVMTSLRESMRQGKGTMAVYDYGTEQQRFYSRHLMCPSTGVAFEDPAPHTFFVQLAAGRLSPLQRSGRGGGVRRREDHSRHEAFAARRGRRTTGQVPQQHAFRHPRNAGPPL